MERKTDKISKGRCIAALHLLLSCEKVDDVAERHDVHRPIVLVNNVQAMDVLLSEEINNLSDSGIARDRDGRDDVIVSQQEEAFKRNEEIAKHVIVVTDTLHRVSHRIL